jgi:flagellar hook-basal body complex protein FliE
MVNPIAPLPASILPTQTASAGADAATPAGGFADILKSVVSQAVDAQNQAQSLSMAAAQGQDVPLQDVVQSLSRAELTLQTLVAVRDKAIDAYQQILQMPV